MKSSIPENGENKLVSFMKLLQIIEKDPLINEKIIQVLNLDSYHRRLFLNGLLEQLRTRHAPEKLLNALSCLFDDKTAADVLTLINRSK